MDPIEKQERKREAWRRLSEQRRRVGLLRGRVVAISLIAFVLLWAVVFAQMATGNDPVLGDSSKTVARTRTEPVRRAAESVETTDPAEIESQLVEAEAVEAEAVELEAEAETEVVEPEVEPELAELEPEPEPEPLTTSQS